MMTKFEHIVREKCGAYLYSLKYVRSLDVILDLTLFDIAKFTQETFFDIFVNKTNIILI